MLSRGSLSKSGLPIAGLPPQLRLNLARYLQYLLLNNHKELNKTCAIVNVQA